MSALKKWKKAYDKYTPVLETIAPDEAFQILEGNKYNRNLNQKLVSFYQKQMENGRWEVNGDVIRIDEKGQLLDGQHRLTACYKSKVPLTTFVIRGLPKETFTTIDCGKSRTPADYLKIDGADGVNLNILAAAARVAMNFDVETGKFSPRTSRMSPFEMLGYVECHNGLYDAVRASSKVKHVLSQSVAAGCYYIFSVLDPEAAHAFFEGLATGAGLSKTNPILTVRNRLLALRTDRRAGSGYQKMIVAYLVQAFNYYRNKKTLSNSVFNPDGEIILEDFAGSMKW